MRPQPEDGKVACHQHFRSNLLVFASFKVCAGMNGVFARPAYGGKQCIQAICVGPLVGVWNNLAARRLLVLCGIHHAPFDLGGIKRHFQRCYQRFDFFC